MGGSHGRNKYKLTCSRSIRLSAVSFTRKQQSSCANICIFTLLMVCGRTHFAFRCNRHLLITHIDLTLFLTLCLAIEPSFPFFSISLIYRFLSNRFYLHVPRKKQINCFSSEVNRMSTVHRQPSFTINCETKYVHALYMWIWAYIVPTERCEQRPHAC